MKSLKSHIAKIISGITGVESLELMSIIETPPSEDMGDFAFPCFTLAKSYKKAPAIIASQLAGQILPDGIIEKVEAKGPYLNFFLKKQQVITSILNEIIEKRESYGKSDIGNGKTIVIDYSSPNIAKPFGIGHLRSTVIGATLKRMFQYHGYSVVGVNHLGDWGTQFGKVILAYKLWGNRSELEAGPIEYLYGLYVRINQEEEKDPALSDRSREEFKKLESGDEGNYNLWKEFSELSRQEFGKIYKMLGVEFESVAGESFYNDKTAAMQEKLENANLLSKSQDAVIINLENYGMPPLLVKKSDHTTLYATRDLAAAVYRKEKYNFDQMIYIVGVAQTLYFRQLFKALELLGCPWYKDCHHVSFGWVKLGEEMMSTRKGNLVLLEDVLTKAIELAARIIKEGSPDLPDPDKTAFDVGVGAVVFADLAYRRDTDISFDWDRMLDFSGNSGPYLQYSHARISSVLRKYSKAPSHTFSENSLILPDEYLIVKKLGQYPEIIEKSLGEYEPYYLSAYLLELCGLFNTYYQKYKSPEDRILSSDSQKAEARIVLTECTRNVLASGLCLLGMAAPEMM